MMDLGPFSVTRVSFFAPKKTSVPEDPSLRFSLAVAIVLEVDKARDTMECHWRINFTVNASEGNCTKRHIWRLSSNRISMLHAVSGWGMGSGANGWRWHPFACNLSAHCSGMRLPACMKKIKDAPWTHEPSTLKFKCPNRRPTIFYKITNNQKSNDHALCWCLSAFSLGQLKSCHFWPPKSGRLDPTQTLGRLHVVAGPIPWSL